LEPLTMNAKQKELLEAARAALGQLKGGKVRQRLRAAVAAVDATAPPTEALYDEHDIDGGQS